MIKNIKKDSKTKRVKKIYTLKPKHFSEENISEESYVLKRLADMNHSEFVADILRWVIMLDRRLCLFSLGDDA